MGEKNRIRRKDFLGEGRGGALEVELKKKRNQKLSNNTQTLF